MKRVALNQVGRLDLIDLQAISDSYGREFMPHPFVHLRSSPFASYQEYEVHKIAVRDRLCRGDLSDFNRWFSTYLDADIRVECVVSSVVAPRGRLLAHRRGQHGFIAAQRPDDHVVEVYAVSPYEIGPAITEALTLTTPGRHAKIAIPDFVRRTVQPSSFDVNEIVPLVHRDRHTDTVSVPRSQVTRCVRVQSHWGPAREWGFSHSKKAVVCVAVEGDGDYLYTQSFEFLTPMTAHSLTSRINDLIAEDVAQVRRSQSE